MILAHKLRLNPTPDQSNYFRRAAGTARFAYNWALARYQETKARGERADWNEIKKDFRVALDRDFGWVREVRKCAPEEALGDLRKSITTYYKARQKAGKKDHKLHFPGFGKRSKSSGGFGLANDKFKVEGHTATLPRLGDVNLAEALRFTGKIRSGRVSERAGHGYLTVVVKTETPNKAETSGTVGIDFGLSRLATLSTGERCESQARFHRSERKLRGLQRGLARKKKGSLNRAKWKLRVVRLHARIANQRQDFLPKFTTKVTETFTVVSLEDLNLKGLGRTRNAQSFFDAGIGEAVRPLLYKSEMRGGLVQKVGRWFPSTQLCSQCGQQNSTLQWSDRGWKCAGCGTPHDRDLNAAININVEGIRLLSPGMANLGVTPVDEEALATASVVVKPYPVEAGTGLCAHGSAQER